MVAGRGASAGLTAAHEPAATPRAPLPEIRDVAVRFGGIVALDRLTFDVEGPSSA